jgi:hypothetical protein
MIRYSKQKGAAKAALFLPCPYRDSNGSFKLERPLHPCNDNSLRQRLYFRRAQRHLLMVGVDRFVTGQPSDGSEDTKEDALYPYGWVHDLQHICELFIMILTDNKQHSDKRQRER